MKFFLAVAILSLTLSGLAQENAKSVLLDEFPADVTCEDALARTDNLAVRLKESPGKTGAVIVRGYESFRDLNGSKHIWPIHFIHRALVVSTSNEADVTVLTAPGSEPSIQFWILSEGETFKLKETRIIGKIPFEVNERIYYASDDSGPCSGQVFRGFVTMLKTNPHLSGYLVHINVPINERTRLVHYNLESFRENNLMGQRMRIYFKRKKTEPQHWESYTEYWLLPKRL